MCMKMTYYQIRVIVQDTGSVLTNINTGTYQLLDRNKHSVGMYAFFSIKKLV